MNKPDRLARKLLLGSLLAVVAVIALCALLLLRGIELDHVIVANLQLEKLYLQLDRKLQLDISSIQISASDDKDSTSTPQGKLDPAVLQRALTAIKYLKLLFRAVDIHNITVGDLSAEFHYREDAAGKLSVLGPGTDILVWLDSDKETLLFNIEHLQLHEQGLELSGEVNIDTDALLLDAQLDALIADTLAINIKLQADREQLEFQGTGSNPVVDIEPIVSLLKLGPKIDPWIIDYLRASQFELESLSGTLPYDAPEQILQTLHAEARVKDISYRFAQGLEPVLAAKARVLFEHGILHIYPRAASFYGQDTGDTYVDIDFNDDEAILLVYVRTRAQASGGIIALLEHYGIPLPFHQLEGLTDTDLTLRIDLQTVAIEADGQFTARDSRFEFGGQQLDVANLDIDLKTTMVTINQLDARLPGLLTARITGGLDLSSGLGDLGIAVTEFRWQQSDSQLSLLTRADQPLRLSYHFRNTGDRIDVPASNWQYGDTAIAVDAFSTVFDSGNLSGSLDKVGVTIDPWLSAQVSGQYQTQMPYAKLNIAVNQLGDDSLRLEQASANLALEVSSKINAETSKPIRLSADGIDIKLQPTRLQYSNNELVVQKSAFEVAPGTTAGLQGFMNFASGKGLLQLYDLKLLNQAGKPLFDAKRTISLSVSSKAERLTIGIPKLGAVFSLNKNASWSADIDDISRVYALSPLLQQLRLNRGGLHVSSATGATPYRIDGYFKFPFGLVLGADRKAIDDYRFSGSYDGNKLQLDINKKLQLKWAGSLDISSNDVGYSVGALSDILASLNAPDIAGVAPARQPAKPPKADPEPGLLVNLHARNSFIALDEIRSTPVDTFFVTYKNGKASAKFHYAGGVAALDYADGQISAGSNKLDISVLTDFITVADLEGGTVEFRANGTLDKLRGALRIENTVIKDYKQLNNMLAFINTLPGLLTFNPPNYNKKGLPARQAYLEAIYEHGVVELQAMVIDSSELDIRGTGIIDLNNNTTDMTFNLISGLRKSVGRIPVIGLLLVGDNKQPTITLKVSGDLENPTVSNSAAKDLVAYPWQLIQNTISLPRHISNQLQGGSPTAKTAP
jgi:hypothetical protein